MPRYEDAPLDLFVLPARANPHLADIQQLLQGAAGFTQYFDRDVPPDFDRTVTPIMAHFATHPDIESTLTQLEILRQHYYPAAAPRPEPKLRLNDTSQP